MQLWAHRAFKGPFRWQVVRRFNFKVFIALLGENNAALVCAHIANPQKKHDKENF